MLLRVAGVGRHNHRGDIKRERVELCVAETFCMARKSVSLRRSKNKLQSRKVGTNEYDAPLGTVALHRYNTCPRFIYELY